MGPISIHSFVERKQVVDRLTKRVDEIKKEIVLYKDYLKIGEKEVKITEVFDMSYRPVGPEDGFLYLHTIRGVKTLCVKSNPAELIDAFYSITR
ncbi:hypothetical protein [Pseudalkalibacillus caeni]|uniref:Uncharacterized protein n=1 Tax=Exobacillus caeni TaxID=2574798 RepID=A0A5R9FAC8_9BACL|nr:hypothetical protein [Pseudalkalibacillus caeni]TLS37514.1 hypothetical protein FCL54_10245 [Pseudalkalibacillus caeni]